MAIDQDKERIAHLEGRMEAWEKYALDAIRKDIDGIKEQQRVHKDELNKKFSDIYSVLTELRGIATSSKGGLNILIWTGKIVGGCLAAWVAVKTLGIGIVKGNGP